MPQSLEFDLTLYPDPLLREVAGTVEEFDEDLRALVAAMLEKMFASKGVGLAAPQVGLRRRILVANPTGDRADDLVLINPRILSYGRAKETMDEGCLSFPGIYAEVLRPERCKLVAQDLSGAEFEAAYDGFLARIVQHEQDHLEGILLVDRMTPVDRLRHRAALEELEQRYQSARAAARARS